MPEEREAVCGVCGGGLAPPLTSCPACETPHHPDCWEFNEGCSIFACPGEAPAPAVAAEVPVEFPEEDPEGGPGHRELAPLFLAGAAGLLLAVGVLEVVVGSGVGLLFGALAGTWGALSLHRLRVTHQLEALPTLLDDAAERERERKPVEARLGQGDPRGLAQAYGLFEQRHPRARLPGKAQRALALELAEAGYRVLAAEALEKALRGEPEDTEGLRRVYRDLFRDDPAFLGEVLDVPPGREVEFDVDPRPTLTGRPQYLLTLTRAGLPLTWQRAGHLPTEDPAEPPLRTDRLAGPFAPAEIGAELDALQDHPVVAVDPEEVALPRQVHEVRGLSLTPKGARFEAESAAGSFPWEEVHAVVLERREHVEGEKVSVEKVKLRGEHGEPMLYEYETVDRTRERFDSVLEVHVGEPLVRFRIAEAHPDLFRYLGRRRQIAYDPNLRLVAKDLVRFAPRARGSRGLYAMLSERQRNEPPLETERDLEEMILWFHGLGAPRIRAWWRAVEGLPPPREDRGAPGG